MKNDYIDAKRSVVFVVQPRKRISGMVSFEIEHKEKEGTARDTSRQLLPGVDRVADTGKLLVTV
jgi:hypothetical protein